MWSAAFEVLTELIKRGATHIAAGVLGVIVAAMFLGTAFFKGRRRAREKEAQLSEQLEQERERALESEERRLKAEAHSRDLQARCRELDARCRDLESEAERLREENVTLTEHFQKALDSVGRVWERHPPRATPAPAATRDRRARIISVCNLKGGVGKTTLTANLGAVFSTSQDVLLIDLDYQHSLTDLCLTVDQRELIEKQGLSVKVLFDTCDPNIDLAQHVMRVADRRLSCLGATELLTDAENTAMARFLLEEHQPHDVRYLLRDALHSRLVPHYDWILLDCPPRLTTATINALTASDFVLIPVILDATSMNAVPRLVKWLSKLKEHGLCPQLSLLGAVANKTQFQHKLTSSEQANLELLKRNMDEGWHEAVYVFERFIPQKAAVHQSADRGRFVADHDLNAIFHDLKIEILKRIPQYAGSRAASLPAIP